MSSWQGNFATIGISTPVLGPGANFANSAPKFRNADDSREMHEMTKSLNDALSNCAHDDLIPAIQESTSAKEIY